MTDVNLASKRLMSQGVISKSDYMTNQKFATQQDQGQDFPPSRRKPRGMTCARDVKVWRDSGLDSCR